MMATSAFLLTSETVRRTSGRYEREIEAGLLKAVDIEEMIEQTIKE